MADNTVIPSEQPVMSKDIATAIDRQQTRVYCLECLVEAMVVAAEHGSGFERMGDAMVAVKELVASIYRDLDPEAIAEAAAEIAKERAS